MLPKSDDEDFTSEILSSKPNLGSNRVRLAKMRTRRRRSRTQLTALDCCENIARVVLTRTPNIVQAEMGSYVSNTSASKNEEKQYENQSARVVLTRIPDIIHAEADLSVSNTSTPGNEEEQNEDQSTSDQTLIEKCGYEMKSFRIQLTKDRRLIELDLQNNNNVNEEINYSSTTVQKNEVYRPRGRRPLWSNTKADTSEGLKTNEILSTDRASSSDEYFICAECERVFRSKRKLTVHLAGHTRLKNFVCTNCQRAFYREQTLQEHEKVCCPPKWLFTCRRCKQCFTRKMSLRRHARLVHPKILICFYCNNSFPCKSYLRNHIQMKHMSTSVSSKTATKRCHARGYFPCSVCSKSFNYKFLLTTHSKIHVKRFECSTCERTFDQEDEWISHIVNEKESFCCAHCERLFCEKKKLKKHIRIVHLRRILCYGTRSSGLTADEIPSYGNRYSRSASRVTRSSTFIGEKLDLEYINSNNSSRKYVVDDDDDDDDED